MTPAYIIDLKGHSEDRDIRVVSEATWKWIHTSAKPGESSWREKIPDGPNENGDKTANLTIGSYENDRALQCAALASWFESTREARKWAKDNGYEIEDHYSGFIY